MAKDIRRMPMKPKPAARRPSSPARPAPEAFAPEPSAFAAGGVSSAAIQAVEAAAMEPDFAAAVLAGTKDEAASPMTHAALPPEVAVAAAAPLPEPESAPPAAEPEPVPIAAVPLAASSAAGVPPGDALASSYGAVLKGMAEINAKTIESLCANSVSTLRFLESLAGARTFADVLRLQADHSRRQLDAVTDQAGEWTALVRKVADDSAGPLQAGFLYRKVA